MSCCGAAPYCKMSTSNTHLCSVSMFMWQTFPVVKKMGGGIVTSSEARGGIKVNSWQCNVEWVADYNDEKEGCTNIICEQLQIWIQVFFGSACCGMHHHLSNTTVSTLFEGRCIATKGVEFNSKITWTQWKEPIVFPEILSLRIIICSSVADANDAYNIAGSRHGEWQ